MEEVLEKDVMKAIHDLKAKEKVGEVARDMHDRKVVDYKVTKYYEQE